MKFRIKLDTRPDEQTLFFMAQETLDEFLDKALRQAVTKLARFIVPEVEDDQENLPGLELAGALYIAAEKLITEPQLLISTIRKYEEQEKSLGKNIDRFSVRSLRLIIGELDNLAVILDYETHLKNTSTVMGRFGPPKREYLEKHPPVFRDSYWRQTYLAQMSGEIARLSRAKTTRGS